MSTAVHVSLGKVRGQTPDFEYIPVRDAKTRASKTLTSTGSSVVEATLVAEANEIWTVAPRTGDVWVAFGDSPDAAADPRELVLACQPRDFGAAAGQKIAIKDA